MNAVLCAVLAVATLAGFNWKKEFGFVPGVSTMTGSVAMLEKAGARIIRDTTRIVRYGRAETVQREVVYVPVGSVFGVVPDSVKISGDDDVLDWTHVYYALTDRSIEQTTNYFKRVGGRICEKYADGATICLGDSFFDLEYNTEYRVLHYAGTIK